MTTSSIEALKSYLEGMTYFRKSDFETAVESFSRAIDADSTFALAYLRLANCYGWMEGVWSGLQAEANEKAGRYKDQLPRRERILGCCPSSSGDWRVRRPMARGDPACPESATSRFDQPER